MENSDMDYDYDNLQEVYRRKASKSAAHHTRYCYACGDPYSHREQLKHETEASDGRRRKKRTRLHGCPSCHCSPELIRMSPVRSKHRENVEASMEKSEYLLADPLANSSVKKCQSSPLSPRQISRCRQNNGNRNHYSKRSCSRHAQQQQQEWKNDLNDETFQTMLNGFMKESLANECADFRDNFVHFSPIKSTTKKDMRCKNHQVSQETQDYSDVEDDSLEKCCEDYSGPNGMQETGEVEASNDRRKKEDLKILRYQQERRILQKLNGELEEFEQMQERRKKSNGVAEVDYERKKESYFTSKLPVPKHRTRSLSKTQVSDGKKSSDEQTKKGKSTCQMEASNSRFEKDCVDQEDWKREEESAESAKEDEIRRELNGLEYLHPSRKYQCKSAKSSEKNEICKEKGEMVMDKNEMNNVLKKYVYTSEDLDLHMSKSHILSVIDKAISNEFANASTEKKNDTMHQGSKQQETCVEIDKILQSKCYPSITQKLLNLCGLKRLKNLRWEYLDNILDKFNKLYSLEKILDDCSPQYFSTDLQSRGSNTDHRNSEEQAEITQHQHEEQQDLSTTAH